MFLYFLSELKCHIVSIFEFSEFQSLYLPTHSQALYNENWSMDYNIGFNEAADFKMETQLRSALAVWTDLNIT